MEIGDKHLVQRASVGAKPGMPNLPYDQFPEVPRPIMPAGENHPMDVRILLMLNVVTPEGLVDDQEYWDIYEDVKGEFSIRRRRGSSYPPANQGRQDEICVWRNNLPGFPRRTARRRSCWCRPCVRQVRRCAGCAKALAGRSFAGRSTIVTVLNEDSQTMPPLNLVFVRSLMRCHLFPLLELSHSVFIVVTCWYPVV